MAVSMLEGDGLVAPREVQEDPASLPRRLVRALLASCLTMGHCESELAGRDFRWNLLGPEVR